MDNFNQLNQILDGRVKENEPVGQYSTFKIGGSTKYYYVAQKAEQLVKAVKAAIKLKIPYYILGGGSNILISDAGYPGLIIRNQGQEIRIIREIGKVINGQILKQTLLEADSGVTINRLVRFCCDAGLAGLESHLGLPGTVGGAIYMNSKWTQPEAYVGDVLYSAKIISRTSVIKEMKHTYFNFGYDQSILQTTRETVVTATFILTKDEPKKLWQRASEVMEYRKTTQPIGFKTAGCTFRNISLEAAQKVNGSNLTKSAGYLLEQVGLKGYQIGRAQFSDKHANFIYNLGEARAKDVKALIDEAKKRVKERFNVDIEPEIVLLGKFN